MIRFILSALLAPFVLVASLLAGAVSFILFWMALFVGGVLLLAFLL